MRHNISGIENSGGKQAGKINKGMENDKHPEIAGRCIYRTEQNTNQSSGDNLNQGTCKFYSGKDIYKMHQTKEDAA